MKTRMASWFCGMWILILAFRHFSGWKEILIFMAAYIGVVVCATLSGMALQRQIDNEQGK